MPSLRYARGAYKRSDLPELRVVNQYVEASPANPGDNAVLLARPSLVRNSEVGSGPIRGLFTAPNVFASDVFALSGATLYRGTAALGVVGGVARVSMASTLNTLLVANDAALFTSDGVTVTTVAFPDSAGVSAVGYLAGYAIAIRTNSRRLYFTLDTAVWDGLDYVSAEQDTGDIVGIAIVSDQIWIFCERVVEVFTPTGNPDAPFQRIEGRVYDKGCLQRDTIAKADNSVAWVGNDRIVYRGDNAPMRISNHGIEERLKNSDAADLRAWVFPWNGHTFYVLRTAEGTFAYDFATQEWCEFASYGRDAWRAHIGVFREGVTIAGDDEEGVLWSLSDAELSDDGDPVERRHNALVKAPGFIDTVSLDCSVGQSPVYGSNAIMEMRVSRDGGNTWGAWRPVTLGPRGNYRARPVWRRLGILDKTSVLDFRLTDASRWRLSEIAVNEALGGRGR